MNNKFITEPVDFLFTKGFFKGMSDVSIDDVIIIKDIDCAVNFAFEQNLPLDYKVWSDVIEGYRGKLRVHADFQNASDSINNLLESYQHQNSSVFIEYRKKKVKKISSKHEDFIFSESREDAIFVLSTIAINRYLNGYVDDGFLEGLFALYKNGGWPCGMKGDSVLVYDPAALF